MRKIVIAITIITLLLLSGCTKQELLGSDCGTVSPGYRDECCARQNQNIITVQCVGEWIYDTTTGECRYVCIETT